MITRSEIKKALRINKVAAIPIDKYGVSLEHHSTNLETCIETRRIKVWMDARIAATTVIHEEFIYNITNGDIPEHPTHHPAVQRYLEDTFYRMVYEHLYGNVLSELEELRESCYKRGEIEAATDINEMLLRMGE